MEILDSILTAPIFYHLSETLLHFLWQGALIALGLKVLLNSVNHKKSELRYLASLMALVLCLVFPLVTYFIISFSENAITFAATISGQLATNIPFEASVANVSVETGANEESFNWRQYLPTLSIMWMIGVFYLSVSLILQLRGIYLLPKMNIVQTNATLQSLFDSLCYKLHVHRAVKLLVSTKAEVPMVVGWLSPVILLPVSMASGLSHSQLEMLLIHELAHIKRNDYLINFCQTLVEIILFFHPCVKWISRQIRIEREYCCDDMAVHQCGNSLAYATALTEAEMMRPNNIPQLAMALTGGDLKKRIFRVVGEQQCSPNTSSQWLASLFSFFIVFCIATTSQMIGSTPHVETSVDSALNETELTVSEENPLLPKTSAIDGNVERKKILTASIDDTNKTSEKAKVESIKLNNTLTSTEVDEKFGKSQNSVIETELKPVEAERVPVVTKKPLKAKKIVAQNENIMSKANEKTAVVVNDSVGKTNGDRLLAQLDNQLVKTQASTATDETKVLSELASNSSPKKQPEIVETNKVDKPIIQVSSLALPKTINQKDETVLPQLVKGDMPYYPSKAIKKTLTGDVSISFNVTKSGKVKNIEFKGDVPASFKRSIKRTLRKWKFEPGTVNGEKSEMTLHRTFSFVEPPSNRWVTETGTRVSRN